MKKSFIRNTAAVMAIVTLLPMFSSCSLFKKKAVLQAINEFCTEISTGDPGKILRKTDGLELDYKKSFKELLGSDKYTEEEQSFNQHMIATISAEVDEKSVKIVKDTATVGITFSIADLSKLENGDYKDISALGTAVDNAAARDIEVTAELKEYEKEWYITNFDDEEFKDLFSFYGKMPAIGRGTLIDTATQLIKSVVDDESGIPVVLAGPNATESVKNSIKDAFDIDGQPTDEQKAFRTAVRNNMSYMVDASTVEIRGTTGSVEIQLTRPNFEVLSGKTFKTIPEIEKAVNDCEPITYYYTCRLERTGPDWFVTNLDSVEFTGLLNYKKFQISLNSVDGTYKSSLDITDKFINFISKEYNVGVPSGCEGKIYIRSTMVLKNGTYEVKIDRDAFISDIKSYVQNNIDKIIQNTLGTTSTVRLDAMAKIAGYKDYADMKQKILNQVSTNIENINTSSLESKGTYTLSGNNITFKSATDTMPGTIDSFGNITVEALINDPDAQKLLESKTVKMTYNKA